MLWGIAVGEAVGLSVLIGTVGSTGFCFGINAKTEINNITTIAIDKIDFTFKLNFRRLDPFFSFRFVARGSHMTFIRNKRMEFYKVS